MSVFFGFMSVFFQVSGLTEYGLMSHNSAPIPCMNPVLNDYSFEFYWKFQFGTTRRICRLIFVKRPKISLTVFYNAKSLLKSKNLKKIKIYSLPSNSNRKILLKFFRLEQHKITNEI